MAENSFLDKLPYLKVKLTFITPVLGTTPKEEEIFTGYLASKAPEGLEIDDEMETAPFETEAKQGWTGFHSDERGYGIYDYMFKGYLKASAEAERRVEGVDTEVNKIRAYKKVLNQTVFPMPRFIHFTLPEDYEPPEGLEGPYPGVPALHRLERPIRAQTPRGERTALIRSDVIPEGSTMTVTIQSLNNQLRELIFELLDYGRFAGLGQWRNGGYGRFTWELVEDGWKV